MQLEAETPVMQCGHTGNSNTSGSGRSKDSASNSDSAESANSRSISESVIVPLEGETPVTMQTIAISVEVAEIVLTAVETVAVRN